MTAEEFYAYLGSPYGYSPDYDGFHTGQDYPWDDGTPIPSPGTGSVALTGETTIHGFFVSVWYPAVDRYLQFCHMNQPGLQSGSVVKGSILGLVGHRGQATAAHLHLAVSTSSVPGEGTRSDPVPAVATLLSATAPATPTTQKNGKKMVLYFDQSTLVSGVVVNGTTLFALAGSGLGEAAWLETTTLALATTWSAQIGGPGALLSHGSFLDFKEKYLVGAGATYP